MIESKQVFNIGAALAIIGAVILFGAAKAPRPGGGENLYASALSAVLPESGYQSKISFGDSIANLSEEGVIDSSKFEALYRDRGGVPTEVKNLLKSASGAKILLTKNNASYYLNLLWPLGLANRMEINEQSPVKGKDLMHFASTGGWTLGKEDNGGKYFNKFAIVPLTKDQEALVRRVAGNTYRPCCGNSTFFQDCNHGSALLGLLELGASQGLTEDELFREALAWNSFWFPDTYVKTALFFKAVKGIDWQDADPRLVMSRDYSSGTGWYDTVGKKVKELGLVPEAKGGASCGV